MKILMFNTSDSEGGAARAAYRLHRGLIDIGVDSSMMVQSRQSGDPAVVGPNTKFNQLMAGMRPALDSLPVRFYPHRQQYAFSPSVIPDGLKGRIDILNPDILHLHWVCGGFMRLETLRHLKRPIVWTLHDSWAFTGGCHVPFDCVKYRQGCGSCPTLGSKRQNDLSQSVFLRKQKAWQGLNLTVVAPSNWLANCAKSSTLFRNVRLEVIPNGISMGDFRPISRSTARELLSLPQDKKLILFGAMNMSNDKNKGKELLLSALRLLKSRWATDLPELVIFGVSSAEAFSDVSVKTHYLGRLQDNISLALAYSAADVFVLPSILENLPNTVMEAMACGTPCVAFDQGGVGDLIEHNVNGYLAKPFSTDELASYVGELLVNIDRRNLFSLAAQKRVQAEFALDAVARRYEKLYSELLA